MSKKLLAETLKELVQTAKNALPQVRIGLMIAENEHSDNEFIPAVKSALEQDSNLTVVCIGPKPKNYEQLIREKWVNRLEWTETSSDEKEIASAMEEALKKNKEDKENGIAGAVALHYPFPIGVTTIGRVLTPAKAKPMLIASCTGTSSTQRVEAMVKNTLYGIATAKALGIENPTVGILNTDSASTVQKIIEQVHKEGYPLSFGSSLRSDGGILLRGNDILMGAVDVCVTDSLTGNVLIKMLGAFTSGGLYESVGWGYGASVGEDWEYIVSIISRASGSSVIAGALNYTASVVRGDIANKVKHEISLAKKAKLESILQSFTQKKTEVKTITVKAPPSEPTNEEVHGIDVLDLENAVLSLWKAEIFAESAMGCTGPVIKFPLRHKEQVLKILLQEKYL